MNPSKRPVNLDLSKFHFPLPAITSILHRISGVLLFFGIAFLLYGLDLSLSDEAGFAQMQTMMDKLLAKLLVWGIVSALLYHLVAGVRHLIMDLDVGVSLEGAQRGSRLVLLVSAVLIIGTGYWLW